jgi:hypothetical protein
LKYHIWDYRAFPAELFDVCCFKRILPSLMVKMQWQFLLNSALSKTSKSHSDITNDESSQSDGRTTTFHVGQSWRPFVSLQVSAFVFEASHFSDVLSLRNNMSSRSRRGGIPEAKPSPESIQATLDAHSAIYERVFYCNKDWPNSQPDDVLTCYDCSLPNTLACSQCTRRVNDVVIGDGKRLFGRAKQHGCSSPYRKRETPIPTASIPIATAPIATAPIATAPIATDNTPHAQATNNIIPPSTSKEKRSLPSSPVSRFAPRYSKKLKKDDVVAALEDELYSLKAKQKHRDAVLTETEAALRATKAELTGKDAALSATIATLRATRATLEEKNAALAEMNEELITTSGKLMIAFTASTLVTLW